MISGEIPRKILGGISCGIRCGISSGIPNRISCGT